MEIERIRKFIHEQPNGVVIRMVDGTEHKVPHRDYITFGPLREKSSGEFVAVGTSFLVFQGDGLESMRLVNALLVTEVVPLKSHSNGHGKGGKSKK
jgi:hypothetical protein